LIYSVNKLILGKIRLGVLPTLKLKIIITRFFNKFSRPITYFTIIVIPIFIYFTASIVNPGDKPKYINESSDSSPFVHYSIRQFSDNKSVKDYLARLKKYNYKPKNAGVYMASLNDSIIFCDHNSDVYFNPASIIKILTSIYAVKKWGGDFQFTTELGISFKEGLKGNARKVFLHTDGDPLLKTRDLQMAFNQLKKYGINSISDTLLINPLIKVNYLHSKADTKYIINKLLRRSGIKMRGKIIIKNFDHFSGKVIGTRKSPRLKDILQQQNYHSINSIAERMGDAFGGPDSLTNYFSKISGLGKNQFAIKSCSGLGENRLTPKNIFTILQDLVITMKQASIPMEKILPANGVDGSTIANRLRQMRFRGKLLAKTGTLITTDEGVSSIAGYINTTKHGLVPFSIMNINGEVSFFIKEQNRFLENSIESIGFDLLSFSRPRLNKSWIYSAREWTYSRRDTILVKE